MSRIQITQETFDAAVAENIELLEMSPDEAVAEAVTQFQAQGVNLDTIVKEFRHSGVSLPDGSSDIPDHAAVSAVKQLRVAIAQQPIVFTDVIVACENLGTVCSKGLAERCLAAKNGGFDVLMSGVDIATDSVLLPKVLSAYESFIDGQPDVITHDAASKLVEMLQREPLAANGILASVLRLINLSCIKHEGNRQTFVALGLIPAVSQLLRLAKADGDVVRAACAVLSSLTLDDDIRVPFGKGHDHAKMIVIEGNAVPVLLNLAKVYVDDAEVLTEVFGVVARLCVRDEFCQQVVEMDGTITIFTTLQRHNNCQSLVRSLLIFTKVLAGSDRAKVEITRAGGIESILDAVRSHHRTAGVCEAGFAAIAAVVLRYPAHCDVAVNAGAPEVICTAMELHANTVNVQIQACACIRNIVSRRSDLADAFLSLGAERLLRIAIKQKSCRDEAKSALRDLGCNVELKELWTGTGRELARD